MLTTAYDTSWVARLPNPSNPDQPLYPAAYEWLLRNQKNDGSWGSEVPKGHDRVISTLAALITLTQCSWRSGQSDQAARRAIVYLNGNKLDLQNDPGETVGFELILPELIRQAQQLRLSLPYQDWSFVEAVQADKLRRIPPLALYGGPNPLTHSLEFLGDRLFPSLVQRCQSGNGSYGCSPSATAYVHSRAPSLKTQRYLDRAAAVDGLNGFTYLHPFESFEAAWVIDALEPILKDDEEMEQAAKQLDMNWGPLGMSWSAECEFTDGDDTAMALRILTKRGRQKEPSVLQLFETPDYFQTFIYERNPSTTTNAHILAALRELPSTPDVRRMILKTLHYLEVVRTDGTHWHDKWHASPLYATDCVVTALAGLSTSLLQPAVEWILSQQNENGSWGYGAGTQEETALAMRSLDIVGRSDPAWQRITFSALNRAGAWLVERYSHQDYPALWIGKGLYLPPLIVRATILGALGRWFDSQALIEPRVR